MVVRPSVNVTYTGITECVSGFGHLALVTASQPYKDWSLVPELS